MVFEKKQKLNLWWLYIIFGIQAIIILGITFTDKTGFNDSGIKETYFTPLVIVLLIFLITYFINLNYLLLVITQNDITYKYWPFTATKTILWEDIESAYLKKYSGLGEYGGWGFRYRLWFKLNDKAFIFGNGTYGLQLVLKNGKKILFSTRKPDELMQFLVNIKNKHQLLMINTNG